MFSKPFDNSFTLNTVDEKLGIKIYTNIFPKPDAFLKLLEDNNLDNYYVAYQKVLELAEIIKSKGGKALLVGGSVRDFVVGKIPKDFDIEIYGLRAEEIETIVKDLGKVSEVGKAFGILKLFIGNVDLDISLPRKDSKVGDSHRDFQVDTDPKMTIKDAARRRDFTMNAITADPLTGELYDPFGGVDDLRNHILRVTDFDLFQDDPLRVLRAVQFSARLHLKVDPASFELMRQMSPLLKFLPKERIQEEFKKLFLKSDKPSIGLQLAMDIGVLREIAPELNLLNDIPQDPLWHPEGTVWKHSLMSVDKMVSILDKEKIYDSERYMLLLAVLAHDLGKISTTTFDDDGHIRSRGHEQAGKPMARELFSRLGLPKDMIEKIENLVANHLTPTTFYLEFLKGNIVSNGAIRRLAKRIYPATIKELVLVSEADHLGRGPYDSKQIEQGILDPKEFLPKAWLLKRAEEINVVNSKPQDVLQGRDLVALGFKGGVLFGRTIALANELRDEKNYSRYQILEILKKFSTLQEIVDNLQFLLKA